MIETFSSEERQAVNENLLLLCDVTIGGDELQINNPKHFKMLVSAISEFKAEVVFVDTISRAFIISNENDNSEIKEQVMKKLKRLAVMTDTAVLGSHHIGKAKLEEGQVREGAHRGRGASSFADQSRVIFNLEKTANEEVILACPKIKGEKVDDTVFKLDKASRWFIRQAESSIKTNYQILIEGLKADTDYKRSEIDEIFKGKITTPTITRILSEAVKTGELELVKRGVYRSSAQIITSYSDEQMSKSDKDNNDSNLQPQPEIIKNDREQNFLADDEGEFDL